jgi:hypothetical protein
MSSLLFASEPGDNALRFAGQRGHVESYFLRANHPTRPLAIWLKATVLAPLEGPALAESWFIWFDGEKGTTFAHKQTQPFEQAAFVGDGAPGLDVTGPGVNFSLRAAGAATGTVPGKDGTARFDLSWKQDESPIGQRLSIFPWRVLRSGPFPKAKLLTPLPSLRFSGTVELPEGTQTLTDWPGMQGHNWGKEHTFEYAWGQCLFPTDDAMVEGFSARVKLAGQTSPRMSALIVRKGGRVFRFDAMFDTWRQKAEVSADRWALSMRGSDGEAVLEMDASNRRTQPMVCLGYDNPSGERSYCFNSKLAAVKLVVRPSDGASFTCKSAHGGALEFLRREPDSRFPDVI